MLSFKRITLEQKELLEKYLPYHKERSCDFTVGVVLMWKDFYSIEYEVFEDTLLLKYVSPSGDIFFPFPQGANPLKGIDALKSYCDTNGISLVFCFVTESDLEIIKGLFTEVAAKDDRMWSDYLYDAQSIIALEGKKYRGQRNHINKFLRQYTDYSFEEITPATAHAAMEFFERISASFEKDSIYAQEDQKKAAEVIKNCKSYSMFGGMLKVDSQIIGISYGEILNDTLFVHIERADTNYFGAYQMLVNMFAKNFVNADVKYINREDDSGDEGLRQSKLSYNPVKLIDKYNVRVIQY